MDWDPNGARLHRPGGRNTQNRGKSKYVRISWDEALDTRRRRAQSASCDTYGPNAILSQADGHGETKIVHNAHGCANRLLDLLGGYTLQMRNPDSWEGWYWGAKHVWGCEPVGQMQPTQSNLYPDIAENTRAAPLLGLRPGDHALGLQRSDGQPPAATGSASSGIKSVYICPDLNYGAAVHADKWIPILPNTDAALQLAIAYVWITEGTYDKEYVATHSVGFDKFEDYVLGKEDGVPKTPAWAAEITGVPAWTIKALARDWASRRTSHRARQRRLLHPRSVRHRAGAAGGRAARACRASADPARHQVKMIEWGIFGSPGGTAMTGCRKSAAPPCPGLPGCRTAAALRAGTAHAGSGTGLQAGYAVHPQEPHPRRHLNNDSISWWGMTLARTR